jgi:hypothetical protein
MPEMTHIRNARDRMSQSRARPQTVSCRAEACVGWQGQDERRGLRIQELSKNIRPRLTNSAVVICHPVLIYGDTTSPKFNAGDVMRVSITKRVIFAVAIAAAAFGSACVPSQAADFGPGLRSGAGPVRATWRHSNWRDRCAWAGYYCLYAWDGYVYSYPFDDRPYAYSARRHRHRF